VDHEADLGRDVDLQRQVTLLDLLDRMLEKGVVLRGQIVLAIAEVQLVKLDLTVLLAAVETWERAA
jgi:gas vesicle structural protein